MPRFVRSAALAAAVLLAAGCSGSGGTSEDSKPSATAPSSRGAEASDLPASLTSQKLTWGRCKATSDAPAPGSHWQCTTLKVPLDYAKPDGETIDIALIRARSTGEGERIGSLLFNFGGPGGSGVSMLPSFADQYATLRERYDLVSFDPRGVAASEGVRCRSDKEIQAAESVDLTPDTATEEKRYFKDAADFGDGCERDAGKLLAHVSTEEAARDMDLMRQVLGDDKLHYMGISYGTELGGVYAHLYPERTGRLVLDAVVDPSVGAVGHAENQTRGFQRALDNYLKSTGQDPKQGTQKIVDLLERIDAKPLPTSSDRELNQTLATTGITVTLYSRQYWPALTSALESAEAGDGTELLALADAYNERDPSGHYSTQSHSQRAISCLDTKDRPTPEEAEKRLAEFRKISPVFGEFLGWDTAGWCHDWPVPGLYDNPEVSAPGAAPILVVGNTGDPATPYEGARKMADELGEGVGVELTWKGEGHGAYGSGSDCVDESVNDYLLDGTVPKDGKVCS
ncbi:alpha/beta fold hydrolase [Streptomyces sp. PSKA54]|uniref:Alpha/beta fold hydrolase n=1 Tax=Streptomyces himalayensis subsp. aureolus TaxID=2758039 RepID=A0A7W2HJB9_9ACTN|nr:alpha/beta hydrolase [Streptomyces himalayensis]MBA4865679.1 alpha/beta fold hydrolase [Streptomyces himalayensis subsp. aureolus]